MNKLKEYILEKLIISNNSKLKNNYSEQFGEGELKKFSDLNIYVLDAYGVKGKTIHEEELEKEIKAYFNDNDNVWIIDEPYMHGNVVKNKINLDLLKKYNTEAALIIQKVDIPSWRRGYYIKKLNNGIIILKITDFLANHFNRRVRWIIKI